MQRLESRISEREGGDNVSQRRPFRSSVSRVGRSALTLGVRAAEKIIDTSLYVGSAIILMKAISDNARSPFGP